MYTMVLRQLIKTGCLKDFKQWLAKADKDRTEKNPDYVPPRRYVTVFGSACEFIAEFDRETASEEPTIYLEFAEENPHGASKYIIPGSETLTLLKKLEL